MNASFYDHAKNLTNAAKASAVARVRREVIAEGAAYRVDFSNSRGERLYFNGGRYDVLSLAKDLLFNGCNPVMTGPCGSVLDIAGARY
jgi:hypothetical protein